MTERGDRSRAVRAAYEAVLGTPWTGPVQVTDDQALAVAKRYVADTGRRAFASHVRAILGRSNTIGHHKGSPMNIGPRVRRLQDLERRARIERALRNRSDGETLQSVAARLGIGVSTLRAWSRDLEHERDAKWDAKSQTDLNASTFCGVGEIVSTVYVHNEGDQGT